MSIPIILNNHNRLQSTEKLCDQLLVLGYDHITILDMGSTYAPLLEWYQTARDMGIEVIMEKNMGHHALWNSNYIHAVSEYPWIVYTDSDIELNKDTPRGF